MIVAIPCLDDELSDSGMRAELVSAPTKRKRGRPKKISVAPVKNKKTSATPAAATATDTIVYCPYCKENIKLKDQQTLKRHIRLVDQWNRWIIIDNTHRETCPYLTSASPSARNPSPYPDIEFCCPLPHRPHWWVTECISMRGREL
jgi:hypothetical protein